MAYQPWMIKYRPMKFQDVVGQDHVVQPLLGMLQNNYICPSMIFAGPWGSGKTSLARITAKFLLCEHPYAGEACHSCDSCIAFDQDNNINYIEQDAASHGKVSDIRELVKLCEYPPMGSSRRVIVIDEAHRVTSEGWNALLKTLETSVEYTVFLFCTTEEDKVLGTIKSRSRVFPLHPISTSIIVSRLKAVLLREGCSTFDPTALEIIASNAKGHLRDALNLLEQAYIKGGISLENVQELTGNIDSTQIKLALDTLSSEPMKIFSHLSEWLQFMTPQEITLTIHELIIQHQVALWKSDQSKVIHGWGDCVAVMSWIASTPTPSTLTLLQNFLVQLISRLKFSPKDEVTVAPTRVLADLAQRPKPVPKMKPDTGIQRIIAPVVQPQAQPYVPVPPMDGYVDAPRLNPADFVHPVPQPAMPAPPPSSPTQLTFAQSLPSPTQVIQAPLPIPAPTPQSFPIPAPASPNNFLAQFAVKKPIAAVGEGPLV